MIFRLVSHIFIIALSISSFSASASFRINADADPSSVTWDNVVVNGGDMLPSMWETPPNLQTTKAFIPATFNSVPTTVVTLTGGSGEASSPIAIDIKGMQYNTSGITYNEELSGLGSGCSMDNVTQPIISVQGNSCISTTKLTSGISTSPFIFFRPIFFIDDTSVTSALNGLPEGIYSGVVPIAIRYYYEEVGGILSYRTINETLLITINYVPVQINDIIVSGDGVMEPVYDTANISVSSTTDYDITVNGYFNNGLVLTLPAGEDYELLNVSDNNISIPYNINCIQCSNTNLVNNGTLINSEVTIGADSGVQTSLNFILNFDYEVNGETLISGDYNDFITITIEPGI